MPPKAITASKEPTFKHQHQHQHRPVRNNSLQVRPRPISSPFSFYSHTKRQTAYITLPISPILNSPKTHPAHKTSKEMRGRYQLLFTLQLGSRKHLKSSMLHHNASSYSHLHRPPTRMQTPKSSISSLNYQKSHLQPLP
jgi:hypothetical protein